MPRKTQNVPPEWSLKVEGLRRSRRMSQSAFGAHFGVSAMAVSRWERGVAQPSGTIYIQLGNLAGDPLCWFFWKCAGLRLSDVTRVLPTTRRRLARSTLPDFKIVHADGKDQSLKRAGLVALPLLPVHAGTAGTPGDTVDFAEATPEAVLASPLNWCPHPASTVCLRVKGNSMSPLIFDGYVIAVDTAEINSETLIGQIVLAYHKEKGLLVSRLLRIGNIDALVSDRREYESMLVCSGSECRIVGKVLWWIGHAP